MSPAYEHVRSSCLFNGFKTFTTLDFRVEGKDGRSKVLRNVSISYHNTTCGHSPEDRDLNLHRRENFKSRILNEGKFVLVP
jgi:hypothetical protein